MSHCQGSRWRKSRSRVGACEHLSDMEHKNNMEKTNYKGRDDLWSSFVSIFSDIRAKHARESRSLFGETAAEEQETLGILESLISSGHRSLYPLMALLSASNNWHTLVIVRMSQFRDILLEGIEAGALSPEDEEGWAWLMEAAETNDPTDFMTDTERFYNLLSDAMEAGNQDARDILNMIWEPEQIIEED